MNIFTNRHNTQEETEVLWEHLQNKRVTKNDINKENLQITSPEQKQPQNVLRKQEKNIWKKLLESIQLLLSSSFSLYQEIKFIAITFYFCII